VWQLLAALTLGLVSVVPGSAPDGSIEDFIDQEMPASGVPGLAYAVVADGEITSIGERGVVEIGGDIDVTPDTTFLIGSISKSFTALAVMQLVEAGEIDLGAEISQYLDVFSGKPAGAITIRQLLSHTSGFSTLQGNSSPAASRDGDDQGTDTLERSVEARADVTPAYGPGERWAYSNLNYQILGRLIEVVSGQEFQAYVTANILEPVGMEHSFVADGEVHESMATGHRPWFGTKRPLPENATHRGTAPQGGVVASANDLARYVQTMMNGQGDVLSAEGKALMMRPASEASSLYGFGWSVNPVDGTVWHDGTSPGFESLATMVPAEKKAVVVLVNGGSGLGFGETIQLRNGITARALDLEYEGEMSRWSQKALFVGVALLPIIYVLSMIWAWLRRSKLRAKSKSGIFGLFSLWFPLFTTLVAAWAIFILVPTVGGAPLGTIRLFQPDFGLALIASAVTGVLWAVFRLGVAYAGTPALPDRQESTGPAS
jgi:CubicO group peptidase (beta-lactamase class C family)